MLNVTKLALERLSQKLSRNHSADDVALRFRRAEGCWRLRPDRSRPRDATFSHGGRNVLLLDEGVSRAMDTMTLDVRQTDAGPRLRLIKGGSAKD